MDDVQQTADAWLTDGEPDWEAIDFDLPCSRCGYELRMLTQPRCPECGLQFEWREILGHRMLRRHEFLFEFRWRERPVRSYLETLWRGLWPWGFWKRISIHEQVRRGPLFFLMFSSAGVFVLALHGLLALLALISWVLIMALDGLHMPEPAVLTLAESRLVELAVLPLQAGPGYLALLLLAVLFILLAATVLLCSLRQTLGRCRVRTLQVFRVAAYAATPACLVGVGLAILVAVLNVLATGPPMTRVAAALGHSVWLGPPAILTVYFGVGLRRYLHLPRAWLLGLTAGIVGELFAMVGIQFLGRMGVFG